MVETHIGMLSNYVQLDLIYIIIYNQCLNLQRFKYKYTFFSTQLPLAVWILSTKCIANPFWLM